MYAKTKTVEDPKVLEEVRHMPCAACGARPSDPDHVKTRGAGGGDERWNLIPLCRQHHMERHKQGLRHMDQKYPGVTYALRMRGWKYDAFLLRWEREENQ